MTIEIHEPEVEVLILQLMGTGRFSSVEEVLLAALRSSVADEACSLRLKQNFADFLLNSPLPGSGLDLERVRDFPRAVEL